MSRLLHCRVDPEDVEKAGDGYVLRSDRSVRVYSRAHKMSKSRGNVVNPDDVVAEYGADSLRLYEMFMGPLRDTKASARLSLHHLTLVCCKIVPRGLHMALPILCPRGSQPEALLETMLSELCTAGRTAHVIHTPSLRLSCRLCCSWHCCGAKGSCLGRAADGAAQLHQPSTACCQPQVWNTNGVEGVHRFLARAWRLFADGVTEAAAERDQLRLLHLTIKRVRRQRSRLSDPAYRWHSITVSPVTNPHLRSQTVSWWTCSQPSIVSPWL